MQLLREEPPTSLRQIGVLASCTMTTLVYGDLVRPTMHNIDTAPNTNFETWWGGAKQGASTTHCATPQIAL